MAIIARYTKQPWERKDYDIDYSEWLVPGDTLDTITTSVLCMSDPLDDTLRVDAIQNSLTVAKLWISGGTHGRKYKVTIFASTVGGRDDEEEIIFTVKDY